MPDCSWLGKLVLYHLPLPPFVTSAEALPIHLQYSIDSPLSGRVVAEFRRPQRQAPVSMNSGRFVGEEQPVPLTIQELVVELDMLKDGGMMVMRGDYAWCPAESGAAVDFIHLKTLADPRVRESRHETGPCFLLA